MRTVFAMLFLASAATISVAGVTLSILEKLKTVRRSLAARETLGKAQSIPVTLDR